MLNVTDSFLKEILLIWAETNCEEQLASKRHFLEQTLWFNSLIRINNAPIFYKEWERRGIRKIKQLPERYQQQFPFPSRAAEGIRL